MLGIRMHGARISSWRYCQCCNFGPCCEMCVGFGLSCPGRGCTTALAVRAYGYLAPPFPCRKVRSTMPYQPRIGGSTCSRTGCHVRGTGTGTAGPDSKIKLASSLRATPRNRIQETALSVLFVPGIRFLDFEFGVYCGLAVMPPSRRTGTFPGWACGAGSS